MKFLLDQNLSPLTVSFLRKIGINAVDIRDVGLAGKDDKDIYAHARDHNMVLMTFDKEFGHFYMSQKDLPGLIIIRMHPQTLEKINNTLKKFFSTVTEQKIKDSIVIVEEHRSRIRPIKPE